ncbi:hypothetical protein FSARC_10496 [Fusarium sarcochroum]|uniref:Uncharacterized protein n=1 Tax=Fusarium sarcochroum TaxID=1208366 RepID=A0A8H4TM36_9HYPO|nr:hypothetical protein FSARC_10496 [Fusarium sarcochroum]
MRPKRDTSPTYEPFCSDQRHGLGKPIKRRFCDYSEIAALLLSFLCSTVGLICCFHPVTAARLGQKYQLIIVGLMLSLMDLCTNKLSTIVFLQLETRWASLLQNYDVIIKKSVLGSLLNWRRGDQRWTLLLSASLAFPLALSVGYKTFIGGRVNIQVQNSNGHYGLTGPVGLTDFASGSALMVNATIPFMFNAPSKLPTRPQAFGFNMLLLDDRSISVAMLDGPSPSYVETIRDKLRGQQSYTVAANVSALSWKLDPEVDEHRDDNDWWNDFYNKSDDERPQYISLYKERKWLSSLWPQGQVHRFFMLLTPHNKESRKIKPTKSDFQKLAIGFVSQRRKCNGKWNITLNAVNLVEGDCTGTFEDSFPDNCRTLHLNDARFLISDFVRGLDTRELTEEGQIRLTAVVSALLWSRLTAFCGINSPVKDLTASENEQFEYTHQDTAWKAVPVLKASPILALVLLSHPVVGIVLLSLRILLSSAPVTGGFGLISVLSGYKPKESDILRGAGLSGEVFERIELDFNKCGDSYEHGAERLQFQIGKARNTQGQGQKKLLHGVEYY